MPTNGTVPHFGHESEDDSATITVTYDAVNRPTGLSFSDTTPAVSYSYDANSNRTQMVDGAGTQSYSYDALDRLTAVTRSSDSFGYSYDDTGNVTLRTYPDATSISYSYDDDGRMSSVTRSGNSANYSYNAAGAPIQITLPNGYVESHAYDGAGQQTQVKHSQGANTLAQFDYAYDADGNPTSATDLSGIETYGYDNRDRLTSVCYQSSCPGGSDPFIRWTYDDVGNRLTEARPSATTNYTYDAADELTQAGSTSYAYDANGNETTAGSRGFNWNVLGQVVSTTSGTSTTSYAYDGDGDRLQAAGATTTNYIWDINAQVSRLAIERNSSGTSLRSYTYGNDLLSMFAGGQNYYFHGDALGSIRNVTSSSPQTEWTYSYEPFGSARTETKNDLSAPDNPMRFTGELLDPDTATYDLRARAYAPADGRFLSLDPLRITGTGAQLASYNYADDDPTRFIDPSGLGPVRADGQAALLPVPFASPSGNCEPPALYLVNAPPYVVPFFIRGYKLVCEALRDHAVTCIEGAFFGALESGPLGAVGGCAASVVLGILEESKNPAVRSPPR